MTSKIFLIYDKKAQMYFQPSFHLNKAIALRAFTEVANDPKTNLCKYPSDFSIWIVGEWDELEGKIIPYPKLEFLEEIANLINKGV